ncbi:MAG: hypothetical protein FJW37_15740 [Acidobacteria bacterium]|nr:hypothetical protein [Acidobacteriota bacterium]
MKLRIFTRCPITACRFRRLGAHPEMIPGGWAFDVDAGPDSRALVALVVEELRSAVIAQNSEDAFAALRSEPRLAVGSR